MKLQFAVFINSEQVATVEIEEGDNTTVTLEPGCDMTLEELSQEGEWIQQ